MTYEKFLEKCKLVYSSYSGEGELEESYYDRHDYSGRNVEKINKPRLIVKWSPGGVSGGSCWESSDPQPYTTNEKPGELSILDSILEEIYPQMSFLQYRALSNQLIKFDSWSVGEYYGNSTDYCSKTIDVKDLYDYLKGKSFI